MVEARPATSSTVSPFVRSAIRNAPVCTSVTRPSMISRRTPPASSVVRSCREATRSIAAVTVSLGIVIDAYVTEGSDPCPQEVPQDLHSFWGQDRFWMELDAFRGKRLVAQAHDDAAAGGADL